jgi:MinD-like ATPase involved in chromosome partitioning or flagellar assembly
MSIHALAKECLQMIYSIIFAGLSDEDMQTIGKIFNPPVSAKIGAKLDAQETREAVNSLTAINNEALIIDLDAVDAQALFDALNTYRVQRPETRIIIFALGRQPGDPNLARLRAMSIHDILAPEETPADMAGCIVQALESPRGDYASSARWGISHQAQRPPGKTSSGIVLPRFSLPGRRAVSQDVCYMPHMLVAVWSPTGFAKSFTALNLAAAAAAKGFDVALVNYDFQCPELDVYFGVKQTGLSDQAGMGVMTFGEDMRPELVDRFFQERWGIKYLPAGTRLGQIGAPAIDPGKLEIALRNVYYRNGTKGKPALTVVDAGRRYEYAPTLTALKLASVVLVPSGGSFSASTVANDQIDELRRLGYCPRFVELFLDSGKKAHGFCRERITVKFDFGEYIESMKPAANRRKDWEAVLGRLAP